MSGAKSVLVTFVGAHVVNDFYATVMPAFLPALADEFGLDYTELGILSLTATLLSGVLQPSMGHYADRHGKRRFVVSMGFALAGIGFLAMALAPTFYIIVTVSLLVGLGAGTYHPQATAFLVQAYPSARGRTLGIHGWGGSIGHFAAPAAVTLAVAWIDWRAAMVVIAIPLLVTAVMLRSQLEETEPNPEARLRGALSRQLILVAIVFGLLGMVLRSFLTFTVKMLVDEGWADTGAGTALTIVLLVGAIAQPIGGRVFDRVGARNVLIGACIGSSLSIAMFSQTSGSLSLVAVGFISLFGFSLFPVGLAVASQLADDGQTGAAVGIIFGVSGLMSAAAQPVVGALGESLGDIRLALSWTIVVTILAIPMASLIDRGHVGEAV
ncbi:MAG: MFS family permease [Paracrocinitomix sp.]|jgi:FSR family fosmidomycin resistance protein-like MFS transporter